LQAMWDQWSAQQAPPSAVDAPNPNRARNRANANQGNANAKGANLGAPNLIGD